MNQRTERILREYIRRSISSSSKLLNEMEYGMSYYDEASATRGIGGVQPGGLMAAFVDPFTNAFKTTVAAAKGITTDALTLLHISFRAALSTILPFVGARYDDIFDRRDEKMKKIKNDYADVFKKTDEALGSGDAKLFAFLYNPALVLGSAAALKAPSATKELLSVATGGLTDAALSKLAEKWKEIEEKTLAGEKYGELKAKRDLKRQREEFDNDLIKRLRERGFNDNEDSRTKASQPAKKTATQKSKKSNASATDKSSYLNYGLDQESFSRTGSFLFEADAEADLSDSKISLLKHMLKNKQIRKEISAIIKDNEELQEIYQKISSVEDETLTEAEALAEKIIKNTKSLESLKSIASKDPKTKDALEKIESLKDPQEKQKAVKLLVDNIAATSKQTFMATLNERKKQFAEGSPQYAKYQEAFDKLKNL